jgi:predicted enzyme related to lactoylglutathione lyase
MPNLAYFEVPAGDLKRAKQFYEGLLQWEFTKAENPDIKMEYWMINTGPVEEGTVNMGGIYLRPGPMTGILTYIKVAQIDRVLEKVEKLGGRIVNPKMSVKGVGVMATILDTEGNMVSLWEPEQI